MIFRCVTFNVKGVGAQWHEKRFEALVSQLRPLNADIICFQESTICYENSRSYDQAQAIGKAIGLNVSAFTPYGNLNEVGSHHRGGVALVSRWPIGTFRSRRLCSGRDNQYDIRAAMFATILAPEGKIEIANTHLSWKPDESGYRLRQMEMIFQEMSPDSILFGDLNATEDEPAIRMVAPHFQDAFRVLNPTDEGITWDGNNPLTKGSILPDRRIDYIFVPQSMIIKESKIVLNQPAPIFPSDHYGVMAELEFRHEFRRSR
jgi:endonuclease/exonuclease/phosphatase family metal-dependent hydrolase